MIGVAIWATGAMGRTALRRVIDHPDLNLRAVHVYDIAKIGLDAGTIARRSNTGIIATRDIAAILASDADVVIHTPRITVPYDALVADVVLLLESGKNVVSTAGFHWPDAHGPAYADRLRDAALRGGATLAGVGVNPGMIVERIALAATAMCVDLKRIVVRETVDASAMTSAAFVFDVMGFGSDPATSDIRQGPLAEMYAALFGEVLHFGAAAMATRIARIVPDHRLTLAPADMTIGAGTISKGRVAATEWRWTAIMDNGVELLLSILWTADRTLHPGLVSGHWTIDIEGRPNVSMTLDIHEGDSGKPPARALTDATVAAVIRALPDVVAAPPGMFAYQPPAAWRKRLSA